MKQSRRVQAFQRGRDLFVDWNFCDLPVDPAVKHHCDVCGTERITGMLFRFYDANSDQWLRAASHCFFALWKKPMPEELKAEARAAYTEKETKDV